MSRIMTRFLLKISLLMAAGVGVAQAGPGPLATPTCTLSQAQWESPDRSRTLLADPALRRLLQALAAQPQARLRIEYPGGEQGVLWAHRLVGYLVAFGIPRQAIDLFPGGSDLNALALSLQPGPGGA